MSVPDIQLQVGDGYLREGSSRVASKRIGLRQNLPARSRSGLLRRLLRIDLEFLRADGVQGAPVILGLHLVDGLFSGGYRVSHCHRACPLRS
jgi:hypothetical protein